MHLFVMHSELVPYAGFSRHLFHIIVTQVSFASFHAFVFDVAMCLKQESKNVQNNKEYHTFQNAHRFHSAECRPLEYHRSSCLKQIHTSKAPTDKFKKRKKKENI